MTTSLIVLDVDGTLLGPSGTLSSRVRDAVQAAHAAGCLITLATGRRLWAVRPIAEELGIRTPLILYNGAVVYDLAGEQELVRAGLTLEPFARAVRRHCRCGFPARRL